ncbi:MAG TPA: hypothetical protein VMT89_05935 [Candidatus Acidoferrales bacterium]|nr:hypothetical protein [Candidatus Acidoferrales bacterium]
MIQKKKSLSLAAVVCLLLAGCGDDGEPAQATSPLQVGVAAVSISPCGENPDYDGPITANGVWGETYTDRNANGRWDPGEPYVDDPRNTAIDVTSRMKYDGIFMAGFGNNRIAKGCADDIWARAIVLQTPHHKIAMVAVDLVGTVSHGRYYGFTRAQTLVDPNLGIDTFIYASTHDHEAPDALGLWGVSELSDGKFPLYLQFIDKEVAKAINTAAAPSAMHPAHITAAQVTPASDSSLLGLQVRTGCRPPWFFDDELRALQFVGDDGKTIATLVNWNTHPESLEDGNEMVSSDFPNSIRARVEQELGGTAVYFSGDLGAVEIVGDTCVGNADPRADGSNEFDHRDNLGFDRTHQIGTIVGDAAVNALRSGTKLDIAAIDTKSEQYYLAGTNDTFAFAQQIGLIDLDPAVFSLDHCPDGTSICVAVEQHLLSFLDSNGKAQIQLATSPGELFPELNYDVAQHHRTNCPYMDPAQSGNAASTGEPYEPSIRNAMTAPYRMIVGLSPDEFGYIVLGYDFQPSTAVKELGDACTGMSYDPSVPNRHTPTHYHESLSVGLDLSATVTCNVLKMLGLDSQVSANDACKRALHLE